jgi:hypothetical protein
MRPRRDARFPSERLRNTLGVIVPYGLLVVVHILFTRQMLFPTHYYDELYYLGEARYFARAGAAIDMIHSGFGEFGYSLLITPPFWISRNFATVYQLVLTTNAFVLSSMLFPLVWLGRRLIGLTARNAVFCAFAVCLYPSFLLYSTQALSENLFVPLFLLTVVACARFAERRSSYIRAIAFGLLSGTLYMVHGPGLAVVVAAVIVFVLSACIERRALAQVAAGVASAIVMCLLVDVADKPILAAMYPEFTSYLPALRHFYGIPSTYLTALSLLMGHLFCTNVSSFGLMGCGIVFAWVRAAEDVRRGDPMNPDRRVATTVGFLLLSFGLTLVLGASFLAVWGLSTPLNPARALGSIQDLVAGRYVEGVLACLLLFGIGALFERRARIFGSCAAVSIGATLFIALVTIHKIEDIHQSLAPPFMSFDCWTLLGFLRLLHTTSFVLVTAVSIGGLLLIYAGSRSHRAVPILIALGAVWIALAATEFRVDYLGEQARRLGSTHTAARLVPRLQGLSTSVVSYDMTTWDPYYYSTYILFDARRRYEPFDSSRGDRPASGAVIAGAKWRPPEPRFERVGCEDEADNCLWLERRTQTMMRGRLRDRL